ncbi:CPBP family intramembrane metalloprotease [Nocardia abscessus]|uniref:CPBP family intramembrane glutamic endopeptidase n=1 Tax=Nocardia abscessus TaxID=120957 RepID=UPI00189335A8|nr:CPBP family intramembrane glutamic endopeptidase [Nocardia abscessus]MBF6335592.1 CPBP family intramembrane metalloprotease [Nocardia abscessus]
MTERTALRYSGDHEGTLPLWAAWAPVLGGLAVARLVPPAGSAATEPALGDEPATVRQAWWLCALGITFSVAFYLSPRTDLWFVGLKLLLLLAIPLLFRLGSWREWYRVGTRGRWLRALPAAATFVALATLLSPGFSGSAPDPVTMLMVFLLNAVLEEIFYRIWLQTRLEAVCGRLPAILWTAMLWASWHVAIQGSAGFGIDLATVVVRLGADGLFLGYLWSRYRDPWLLFVVHGLINAPIAMLSTMR